MTFIENDGFTRQKQEVAGTIGAAAGVLAVAADKLLGQEFKDDMRRYVRDKARSIYRGRMRKPF